MHGVLKQGNGYFLSVIQRNSDFDSIFPDHEFTLVIAPKPIFLGRVKDGTSLKGLLVYLDRVGLDVEEKNCAEIAELFGLMSPQKDILKSIDDLFGPRLYIRTGEEERARAYTKVIQPPLFVSKVGTRQIRLWTVDRWRGDLERWEISEDSQGKKQIESEILEKGLILTLN